MLAYIEPVSIFLMLVAKVKSLPERICIQPQMWKTVVDFRKIMNIKHMMVRSEVATAIPAKIVATWLIDDKYRKKLIKRIFNEIHLKRHRRHIHHVFKPPDAMVAHLVSLAHFP